MEGTENDQTVRERLEREAREAEHHRTEGTEPLEISGDADETLPDPNSEPGEVDPNSEHVDVPCAGCGTVYGFDIKPNTSTFTFECRSCGTKSEWSRI